MIFAHQGGWDEMLMVAVPIGLFVALLALANRRAEAKAAEDARAADARSAADDDPPPG